jgi:hypothetical protein
MALDFPASPSDGDVYGAYYYDASVGAWKTSPAQPTTTSISVTKPSNPNPGDTWFDTTNGTLFIYYEDEDSSQWVEVQASSSLNTALEGRIGVLETEMDTVQTKKWQSYNYIINGALDIWQRGTSFNLSGYTADRWALYYPVGTTTLTRESTIVPTGFDYSAKLVQTTTTGNISFIQSVESLNSKPLAGKTTTLSAYVYGTVPTSFSISLRSDTVIDKAPVTSWPTIVAQSTQSVGNSWTRITATGVVPENTQTLRVDVSALSPELSQPFYIAGVQLEEGPVATPFRRNAPSIQAEFAACQRYYWRVDSTSSNIGSTIGTASTNGGTTARAIIINPSEFRAVPTSIDWTGTVSHYGIAFPGQTMIAMTGTPTITTSQTNTKNIIVNIPIPSGSAVAAGYYFFRTNEAAGRYFGLSAEL